MSVAEALRQQRAAIPVNPKLPPSILHAPRAASRIPLSEQASLTLNSISLLSTVDDRFPSFATNLLLENPVSRQTLDPTAQDAVSVAVISISRHLAPIFPVRHAQRVYEWLVNGLHTGLLGTDAEIDALLLSALPFYSTAQFPTFVSAVVKPRPRGKWTWLKSVVDTSKPASTSYFVQYCPINVHRMTIEWGVQLASDSIPCTFSSSFLANVTARWISTTATTDQRRSIVSDALIAISSVVSLNQKDISHFVCSLFAVISSAVVSGVSEDTSTAIASAATVVAGGFTDEIAETAFAMLGLLINRYGPSCLVAKCARNLISKRKAGLLSKLGEISQKLYSQIVLCALGNSIPKLSKLDALKEALFGDGSELISSETVTEIVAKLLDLISFPETSKAKLDQSKDIYDPLVSILTPLARGRFSNAVDLGLRLHFDGRTTAKADAKTKNVNHYAFADKVLSASLHGTSFQIIKSKSGDETMDADGMMMLSALDHPELSVRKNALERIADAYAQSNEDQPISSEDLQSKVLSIIKYDTIPSVVLSACDCVFRCSSLFKSDILFNEIGSRLLAFLDCTASESKNSGEVQLLTEKYMVYLSDLPLNSQSMDVLAFIIGTSTNKLLGDSSQVLDQAVSVLRKCCTHMKIALPPFADRITADSCAKLVSNAVEKLALSLNFRHGDLLQSLVKWNPSWTFGVIKRWAETFHRQPNRPTVDQLMATSTHTLSQSQLHTIAFKAQFNQVVVALAEDYLKQTGVSNKKDNAILLWKLSASKITGASCGKVLHSLVIAFEKSGALKLLKKTYEESKEARVQVISFKWYMYLASTHQTPNRTLIDLIKICYGDNVELREQGKLFCKNYLKLLQTSNEVSSFCRALSKNSSRSIDEGESIDVSKKLNLWLHKLVIKPQVERLNTLSPLPHGGGISKIMANNILEAVIGAKSSKDMLPLLRVLFHCQVDVKPRDCQLSLWSPLYTCLETLLRNRDLASLESAARLIMLLSTNEDCHLSLQDIGSILKSIQHVFESKEGEDSANEALRITLLAGGIFLTQPEKASKQPKPIINASFFELLLSLSSKSSTIGLFVREVLDEYKEALIPFTFLVDTLSAADPFLKNIAKRRKIEDEPGVKPGVKPVSLSSVCIGALETIRRLVSSASAATYLSELDDDIVNLNKIVWELINSICSLINEKSTQVGESMEYILLLSLDILSALVKCNHLEKTLYRTDSSLKLLCSLLSYSGWDSEREEETASVTAIKKSILDFVVVLAPVSEKQLKEVSSSVISALLKSRDLGRISSYFDILIPCLLKSKMEFKSIAEKLCTAAFASSNPRNRSDLRTIVASTCRFAPDVEAAVTDSITHIFKIEKDRINIDQLGRECSLFLLAASLNVTQDIIVISNSTENIRSQLASFVLMDSSFMTKLFETMTSSNHAVKTEVMKMYSEMIVSLARCKTGAMKESAMGTAFRILPLSGLGTCFVRAMNCNVKTRTEVMNAFASRLNDYNSPLVMDWNEEHVVDVENDESNEKLFLEGCSTRISDEMKSNDLIPIHLIRAAFDCSEGLLKRFGAADTILSMRLANDVLEKLDECMIHVRGISNDIEEYCDSVSAALRCQSTVITEFGTQAVGIIPRLLDAAVTLIELASNGKSGKSIPDHENILHVSVYSMTDSAVRVCLSIIESAPKFFGEKSLKRLTDMLVKKNSKVLEDILRVGMRQLPGVSVVSAVASTCEQLYDHEASASGIGAIMDCLRDGLSSLKKSEVKLEGKKLLGVALRCLEFGRGDGSTPNHNTMLFPRNERLENIFAKDDPVLSVLKFVDDKCGNLLTTLILRLPESEFKVLFDKMAHWCDAGTIPDQLNADCKKVGVSLHNNLLRAVPFYRLSLSLFDNLEVIMVPYYMQQLSKVLGIIELPNVRKQFLKQRWSLAVVQSDEKRKNGKGKKRKRVQIEEDQAQATCDHFTRLQVSLQDLCLDGVTKMLNQGSNSTRFLGVETVSKVQDSLLKCFDERDGQCERVRKALCALCVRISEMRSGDGSREESRELLNSVSRHLLQRTREDIVALREGSLIASRAIAVAVGDEYLVTLPETMPVLAEVIDDEDIAVQKAAKAFGIVMETMAGEPLLSQLK